MIHHLQKLTATGEELYAKVCTVHRVDKENNCCDVIPVDGTAELFDVSFQADSQGGGLCFYPAVNSNVLVVFINKHHACICQVSELDLMKLVIDKMEFSVDKDGLSLKNGDVEFLINEAGLNLEKGKVKFSVGEDGLLLKTENQSLKTLMGELLKAIAAITVTSPPNGGITTTPINAATFTALQTKFDTLLKD